MVVMVYVVDARSAGRSAARQFLDALATRSCNDGEPLCGGELRFLKEDMLRKKKKLNIAECKFYFIVLHLFLLNLV